MALESTLPRESYVEQRFFARECDRIFHREWFCVGRGEEAPRAGDYVVRDVGGESIIVVRTRAGTLAAHHNVCRHRGTELLDAGTSGNLGAAIRCPYHAWSYEFDGRLRSAPFMGEIRERRDDFRLFPVALEEWGGFAFVRLEKESGTPLVAELGPVRERLRRYPLAELRRGRRLTYEVAANWKVLLENYNECYHCAGVHPELCALVPDFKRRGGAALDWERGIPHRAGATTFTLSGTTTRAPFAGLDAAERTRHKGELIYPNLMLSLSADHVAAFALVPRDAANTTVVCDFLFAPQEVAAAGFDPSDAVDFWDLVNRQDWAICERVQRGMTSRAFTSGFYAPMEDASLDIRRYIEARLGTGREA